jgi:hypothetical protein
MAEGFLSFVDKTELEIDAKPDVEIISKRTSTRYLDVKHESGDKKKENKKEKEKAKDMPSDLPGGNVTIQFRLVSPYITLFAQSQKVRRSKAF